MILGFAQDFNFSIIYTEFPLCSDTVAAEIFDKDRVARENLL
jgi:hypothetical protein